MNLEDIKQEPDNYIKQEPDNYTQPPQRTQHQRVLPKREPKQQVDTQWSNAYDRMATPSPRSNSNRQVSIPSQFNTYHRQPSTHHHKREMPREYSNWNWLESSPRIGGNPLTESTKECHKTSWTRGRERGGKDDITPDKYDPQSKPTWTGSTTADVSCYDYYIYCSVYLGILRRKVLSKRITFIK